jgi:glycosyltransferase involved in cell wall biosynthesis
MPTNPIHVLHLIKSLGRGGAETLLVETLTAHNQEKFNFHYIYFLPWKNQLVAELELAGGIVSNVPAINNLRIIFKFNEIIRYIKQHNILIIHCHLPWAGFLGRLIHYKTGIPVIYSEHNKQERYHFLTRFINKFTFNSQSLVIAVSDDVKTSIFNHIQPKIPVNTIFNGINTEKYRRNIDAGLKIRSDVGIAADAIVIGSLGVFRTQKRIDCWLELFSKLYAIYPDLRGILVGDGPLKKDIIAKRKLLGLENVVFLPGIQTNAVDWYSAMDIFMMTSEFEGLPLSLLEAMSCECAVVATNAGGIKEVLVNRFNGFTAEVDQWTELFYAVEFLLSDPTLLKAVSHAARSTVIERFSIQTMISQLESTYSNYAHSRKH